MVKRTRSIFATSKNDSNPLSLRTREGLESRQRIPGFKAVQLLYDPRKIRDLICLYTGVRRGHSVAMRLRWPIQNPLSFRSDEAAGSKRSKQPIGRTWW